MPFANTNAPSKPTLICLGTLKSIAPATPSQSDNSPYYLNACEITTSGSNFAQSFRLMWDPAFLSPTFSHKDFNKKNLFVYNKNISGGFTINKTTGVKTYTQNGAFLYGLCGDDATFEQFQVGFDEMGDYTVAGIDNYIRDFFTQLGPVPFMYILKQDERDGVLTKYYKVAEIYHATEQNVKTWVSKVEYNNKKIIAAQQKGTDGPVEIKFKFEPSQIGLDIELPELTPSWV